MPVPGERLVPRHFAPDRVPREVARYAGRPDTLGVGRPGKIGLLELGFERAGGRTELVHHYQKSPLQIMRPLYVDPVRPDLPVVYLMATGGGIVQADRLRLDVECGADTSVLVTTQAATKVHRMDSDYATQLINLTVGPRSYVEYLPEPTIPFANSRFYQRCTVIADPSATVLVGETVLAGRLARGERYSFDVFASDFEVRRPTGEPVAIDTVRLEPARMVAGAPAMLGPHTIMGSFYAVSPLASATEIADALHAALDGSPVLCGVSTLPLDGGAWLRLLGSDPPAMTAAMRAAWDATRRLLIGTPAPALRKT